MPVGSGDRSGNTELRPLCKREIDERIDELAGQVMRKIVNGARLDPADRPQTIELRPADLVRSMRPFLVYN